MFIKDDIRVRPKQFAQNILLVEKKNQIKLKYHLHLLELWWLFLVFIFRKRKKLNMLNTDWRKLNILMCVPRTNKLRDKVHMPRQFSSTLMMFAPSEDWKRLPLELWQCRCSNMTEKNSTEIFCFNLLYRNILF